MCLILFPLVLIFQLEIKHAKNCSSHFQLKALCHSICFIYLLQVQCVDSANVSKKVTRKEMSGCLLVLTDSPRLMHSARIEQKCFFPQWHLSVLSQEVVLDVRAGQVQVWRQRGRGAEGLQIGNQMKKIEERVSSKQVQTAVISN